MIEAFLQASYKDYVSFRNPNTGSWFIQALCSTIDDSHPYHSLDDILTEVRARVAKKVNFLKILS